MKKLFITLFVALCLCTALVQAQSLTKTDVVSVKVRSSGAIIQNQQVKGYYYFYNLEKQDRKNNNYMLSITDENLREINSVTITRPNSYLLIDAVFNGEAFGFLFYDAREGAVELMGYDKALKPSATVNKEIDNKYGNASYQMIVQGNQPMQSYLVGVPNKGFVYYGIDNGPKAEAEIEFYDNKMKKGWTSVSPRDDKFDFEMVNEGFQDDTYVGSIIGKRDNALSMDITFDLAVHKIADGKVLFRIPLSTAKYNYTPSEVVFDEKKQQFLIFGEYFNQDEKIFKAESQGFIALTLDMKGKVLSEKVNSWDEVSKKVDAKDKDKYEKTDIIFHDFIRTADGQIFAVGEQYKRSGTPPLSVKLGIYNMVIFQFDKDFAIKKVNVFEKSKNNVQLPNGMMMFNSKILSWIAKSYGGFDYVFSQMPEDKKTFMVSYINFDRDKGKKGSNVLGTIVYTPEKVFVTDNLPLTTKSSSYFVYRAKSGYVMVNEYFAKEKKLDSRLEKVNY